MYDSIDNATDGRPHPSYDELASMAIIKYGDDNTYPKYGNPYNPAAHIKETIRKMINGNAELRDIIAEISKQDQETINYIAGNLAYYFNERLKEAKHYDKTSSEYPHLNKLLTVGKELCDKSTGEEKVLINYCNII